MEIHCTSQAHESPITTQNRIHLLLLRHGEQFKNLGNCSLCLLLFRAKQDRPDVDKRPIAYSKFLHGLCGKYTALNRTLCIILLKNKCVVLLLNLWSVEMHKKIV